jgi:hypothetical protein
MKTYRFPTPQARASNKAITFQDRVSRFLVKSALQELLIHKEAGLPLLSQDELSEWIGDLLAQRGSKYLMHGNDPASREVNGSSSIGPYRADRLANRAAEYALHHFNPDYLKQVKAKAKAGGRKSKRPSAFGPDQLAKVVGLSLTAAADVLGCTPRTVSRMRARARALDSVTPVGLPWITGDRILDEILAETRIQIEKERQPPHAPVTPRITNRTTAPATAHAPSTDRSAPLLEPQQETMPYPVDPELNMLLDEPFHFWKQGHGRSPVTSTMGGTPLQ